MSPETKISAHPAPGARLLIATGCAHCPAVLDGLSRLLKEGRIGRLEVINLTTHPEVAQSEGVRSVPWFTIGPFALSGQHSFRELEEWVDRAASGSGIASFYHHLLETNRLPEVVERVRQSPSTMSDLLLILGDPETPMSVRIGIGAAIEDLAADGLLSDFVERLGALTRADQPQIRADACHYLGLAGNPAAAPLLEACLGDDNDEVREIAAESLALLHPESARD